MDNFREFPISALNYLVSKVKALLAGKQDKLTFDSTPIAGSPNPVTSDGVKAAIDATNNTFIFEMVVSLSASGITLSLPQGVTYADIDNAVNNKLHVIAVSEIPSVAGTFAGRYLFPFVHKTADGNLVFSAMICETLSYCIVTPQEGVGFTFNTVEMQGSKVQSIDGNEPDWLYPSAKAVYDAIQNVNTGFANGESDMYT